MSEGVGFVDTRFHIHVTPLLEHKLPHVGKIVCDALFDEESEVQVVTALKELVPRSSPPCDVETLFWYDETDIDRECASVCTNMNEHLQRLSREWITHVRDLRSKVRNVTTRITSQMEYAKSIHAQYRSRNPSIVDQELREEFLKLSRQLDEELQQLRARPLPTTTRPEELTKACLELKKRFADSHGTKNVRDIVRSRNTFEAAMQRIERDVATEFVEAITSTLD